MQGKVALKKYRLLRLLGQGSNGAVYLAQSLVDLQNQVVVKVVHPQVTTHPKFRQLFEAEVRSMSNFSHPYAVQFIEASLDDPLGPCLVMEYVPGITLEALLARQRALDLQRVGRLLGFFCHALQAAHDAGIIHRDLKPANLMVVAVGTVNESLKVMDFGFAGFAAKPHLQLAELTGRGPVHAIGTPAYVSPEMIRGDSVDARSDLYAVGVILYELLTGRLPFNHEYMDDLLNAHVNESPPRFAKVGMHDIPAEVEETVRMALTKFPNERPQSPRELAQMFGRAMNEDIWEATAPQGWEPMPIAAECTPEPSVAPHLPRDPYHVTFEFETATGERMIAAKIRGFMEDMDGQVIASEPGQIRLQVGMPGARPKGPGEAASPGGSGILSWFRMSRKPHVPSGQEPIEIELNLEKPDPSQSRLLVGVICRPLPDYQPTDPRLWQSRCERLVTIMRRYLGA